MLVVFNQSLQAYSQYLESERVDMQDTEDTSKMEGMYTDMYTDI